MPTARNSATDVNFSSQVRYRALPGSANGDVHTSNPTKHGLKAQETRELLLRAAERIFVRDGYEKAELGEIARLAGRTKGAIYAQFKSKEDVFLALVQDHALRRRAIMRRLMEHSATIEGNLEAFRKYFLDFATDDTWGFLLLEFRLYSVRNPDSQERFRKVYESILPVNEEEAYSNLLGPAAKGREAIGRTLAVHTGFSMLTALQLECKFDPKVVDSSAVRKIAGQLFDMLFQVRKPSK